MTGHFTANPLGNLLNSHYPRCISLNILRQPQVTGGFKVILGGLCNSLRGTRSCGQVLKVHGGVDFPIYK